MIHKDRRNGQINVLDYLLYVNTCYTSTRRIASWPFITAEVTEMSIQSTEDILYSSPLIVRAICLHPSQ
jgi:hypothetical protein